MAETKSLPEQLAELKADLQNLTKEEIKTSINKIEAELKAIEGKADKAELEKLNAAFEEVKAALAKNQTFIDAKVIEDQRKKTTAKQEVKSFNEILGEAIEANKDRIQSARPGEFTESNPLRIPLMPELKQEGAKPIEVKEVGDMTIANNFANASTMYQDVRNNLIETPYNKVWLSDILPTGSSTGTNVVYPKENGGEGAAALWTDYTANKAQIDFDLTSQTAYFKWIAGWVVVQRDMIDDIPWMTSYLQSRMLISLKTAENAFIMDGSTDTNPVQGLQDVATAYSNTVTTYTNGVDRIIDAAWGQIVEETDEWYAPTHVIVSPRDTVKIGINKASGSGEYDLPAGSVSFVNGKLTVGGLMVVGTTQIASNTFIALDNRATMFIRRIQPELRMFESADLAKKNQLMFRIEEKATLVTFNDDAIVKGVLYSS